MINHALLAEAKRAADTLEPVVKRMKRYADRKAVGAIDPDYMDRIHELLEGYSFRSVSRAAMAERDSFEKWAAGQKEQGYTPYVPPRIQQLRGIQNYQEVSVAELTDLNLAVSSLAHLGKRKRKYMLEGQARDFRRDVKTMRKNTLDNLAERAVPVTAIGDSVKPVSQSVREGRIGEGLRNLLRSGHLAQLAREAGSGFIKTESVFDQMDGTTDGTGLYNKVFMHGGTKANNVFSQLSEEVLLVIHEAYKGAGRDTRRLDDHMEIPELALRVGMDAADPRAQRGLGLPVTRKQFYGMLANTGNLSNLGKMVGGEKWGDHESMTDMVRVRDILWSHATADDAKIVQAMWDAAEKLWPHIVRVERAMTGVAPEKVVPLEFSAAGVALRGGYWPVMWDSARSDTGKNMAEDIDGIQGTTYGVATSVGHTITRTGATAPMEYNIDIVLGAHMNKVISRIAYAEYIRDGLHFINHKSISGAIDLRLGREYTQQIKTWLKDQIPSSAITLQGAKLMDRFLNASRINMSFAVLAMSFSTGISQSLGLSYAVARIGEGSTTDGMKYVVKGFIAMLKMMPNAKGDWAHKLSGAQDFVFARSEEMMRRRHEVNQESIEVFRNLKNKNDIYHKLQAAGFWHIGMVDLYMVSLPTWLGAYAKHLDTHPGDEQGAARYGDKMVRQSQGSGRNKDLTALQRGPAGQKFLAMFFTPGAVMFDAQWNALQDARGGDFAKAAMPMFWMIVIGGLAGAMQQGDWPDDEEDLQSWATWALRNTLFETLFGIPVVRDVANTSERLLRKEYSEYGSTPLSFMTQTLFNASKTGYDLATKDEPMTGAQFKKLAMAVGLVGRLPGAQMGRTGGFVIDEQSGAVEPQSAYDWYHGLAYGKMPKKDKAR